MKEPAPLTEAEYREWDIRILVSLFGLFVTCYGLYYTCRTENLWPGFAISLLGIAIVAPNFYVLEFKKRFEERVEYLQEKEILNEKVVEMKESKRPKELSDKRLLAGIIGLILLFGGIPIALLIGKGVLFGIGLMAIGEVISGQALDPRRH